MHDLMYEEDSEFAELFIEKGLNLNVYRQGKTLLHEAVIEGSMEFTKLLIERGSGCKC